MPYREVDALALVSDSAGLQARPENCYVQSTGSYIQVLNLDSSFAQAHAYPEVNYGLRARSTNSNANLNRRSPMGEHHVSLVSDLNRKLGWANQS